MQKLLLLLTALAVMALAPAVANAARPGSSTGGVESVAPDAATLVGSVDPNGEVTEYFFEYGPTKNFGFATAVAEVGPAGGAREVKLRVTGLAPDTSYRYRLVARNGSGVTPGNARGFKTKAVPLGLALAIAPNPLRFGDTPNIATKLSGSGNAGLQVVLQQRVFPYTSGFGDLATATTNATGDAVFSAPPPTRSTQYRTRVQGREVFSAPLTVGVGARIATYAASKVRKGGLLTLSGTVRPARPGSLVVIQKLGSTGSFVTIGYTRLTVGSDEFSRYKRRVRVPKGGSYRITVIVADGNVATNSGRTVKVSTS